MPCASDSIVYSFHFLFGLISSRNADISLALLCFLSSLLIHVILLYLFYVAAPASNILIKVLKRQERMMGAVLEVLEEIGDKDCYDRISNSSKPRELSKLDYDHAYGVRVADLKCMITSITHAELIAAAPPSSKPKNPITLSHLVARNADAKERLSLGFRKADIENIRNSLLLCKGIEEAFDHKFISFVPADKPFYSNRYRLCIWVDAIRTEPIYEGSTLTIGSFEGALLDLTVAVGAIPHNPFSRALSYQTFRAFKTWGKGYGLTELPEDSDISIYQGSYKKKRASFALQLAKDIESEDGVDQDDAVGDEGADEESSDENA